MSERRSIGEILVGTGRVTVDDVDRALEYQRRHGGYLGEALVALGEISQEELEWSLASQFDLPYVFPDADSVDLEAAALVSPEWALAHLTLPIMRTREAVTVVVDSPMRSEAVDELAARTDLRIDLALAAPGRIRELIRQVYARAAVAESEARPTAVSMREALGLTLDAGAPRFGVSTRGTRSWFWYDEAGTVRRRPLEGGWKEELAEVAQPSPVAEVRGRERAMFQARVERDGTTTRMDVRYMADESGHEFLFRPVQEAAEVHERFARPAPGILSEIRLLARSGTARFIVTSDPPELGHALLPHLPELLLDPSWRSIHVHHGHEGAAEEAFSLRMPSEPGQWASELETLRAFHFDVVTVDLSGNAEDWASTALDVASVAFLCWPADEDRRTAWEAGIRWELHVEEAGGEDLEWSLDPLGP